MLQRVTLRDFQKHQKRTLRLHPRVTTIVGRNGAGKSALLRALRWVCSNRPAGDAFIRQGASEAQVVVWVDGRRIRRSRGKDRNLYELDDSQFTAFGSQVPDPIVSLLNMPDRNFQGQHDPPFWFGLSPGQVSRELNQVFDLDLVDQALSRVASVVRSAKAEVQVCEKRLAQAETDHASLLWVDEATTRFQVIQEKQDSLQKIERDRDRLEYLAEDLMRSEEEVQAGAYFVRAFASVQKAAGLLSELESQATALDAALSRICDAEEGYQCAHDWLRDAQADLSEMQSQGCPLCGQTLPA